MLCIPRMLGHGICGSRALVVSDMERFGRPENVDVCTHPDGTSHAIDDDGEWCADCKAGLERGFRRAAVWEGNPEYHTITRGDVERNEQNWLRMYGIGRLC